MLSNHFNPRSLAGATYRRGRQSHSIVISIHAPSQERPSFIRWQSVLTYFNPRSLAGATLIVATFIKRLLIFQSTLPRRSDSTYARARGYRDRFQSTLPRRSDIIALQHKCLTKYFNPRSLAGATGLENWYDPAPRDFNPRSLAGATKQAAFLIYYFRISIHAPSQERPWLTATLQAYRLNFNPRSLAGATHSPDCGRGHHAHFNPRSLAGATERPKFL